MPDTEKPSAAPAELAGEWSGRRQSFHLVAQSEEEEQQYNFWEHRNTPKPSGVIGSVAHMVKGALGSGILSGHVGYMKAGIAVALPLAIFFGVYMSYCLYILGRSAQVLYRRTHVPVLTYPDIGECSVALHPNPKVSKWSSCFRHAIDTIICIDLFGSCACYHIIIAKSIKQLVENSQSTPIEAVGSSPDLRVYMAAFIVPIILICLITHLKWLAPFSIVANFVIAFCIGMTIYYCMQRNPTFSSMKLSTNLPHTFHFMGMVVFSMSCAGVVIPIENNMKDPNKYGLTITIGMTMIVAATVVVSTFGYAAFLEESDSPITVNFPMTLLPKILKGGIALMIFVTHALNFWVPFNICFYYIKPRVNQEKLLMWELIFRAIIVIIIGLVAICFPDINALMGFIGAFCLSNMAFIWPNVVYLLVVSHRPGFGKYNWRLWKGGILIAIGVFLCCVGSVVNGYALFSGN